MERIQHVEERLFTFDWSRHKMILMQCPLFFAANILTISILSSGKCGLSICITRYLVWMAAANLMHLIFGPILFEINDAFFPSSVLHYTPICRLNMTLIYIAIDCSVWLTVAFTFDRFVAICCQSLKTKYCTEKKSITVITIVCLLCIVENMPVFFLLEPREVIDNAPWYCTVKSSFYTLPIWAAFLWLDIILTPFLPFVLIFLFNALTISHIIRANRIRSKLRRNEGEKCQVDQEIENRRKSIILLLAISGSFLLLWTVNFACFVALHFTDNQLMKSDYRDPFAVAEETGFQLRVLSTCTNTFIYAASQRNFREEMKKMIKRPLVLLSKLLK